MAPIPVTQRKREEMPSCSQAMQYKTISSCPTHFTPTENAVLGAYSEKNKQCADQCQPMHVSNPTTKHTVHAHCRHVEDRKERDAQSPLAPTTSSTG